MSIDNLAAYRALRYDDMRHREKQFEEGFHWCNHCKKFLSVLNFSKNKSGRFGLTYYCRPCHSKQRKGNGRVQQKSRNYNREIKSYYKNKFGGACAKCGYNRTQCALEFHHVNPDNKEHTPAKIISSNDHPRIMMELDKCILLCSNCHMEIEGNCWSAEFEKADMGWTVKPGTAKENETECWSNVSDKILFEQSSIF